MKKLIYGIVFVSCIIQSAAEKESRYCNDCILRQEAQLPIPLENILLNVTRQSLAQASDSRTSFYNLSTQEDVLPIQKEEQHLINTPLGLLFKECLKEGYNESLTLDIGVIKEANRLFESVLQAPPVKEPLKLAAAANGNINQILLYLHDYSIHFMTALTYEVGQKTPFIEFLSYTDNMEFFTKAAELIEINAKKMPILPKRSRKQFMATMLAVALSLRLQLEECPEAFAQKYAHFQQ